MPRDYYEVLSVERDADAANIKSAYRRCAMQHHPDRNPGDAAAEERFKEAAEAYEVLSNREKRQLYDQHGHAGPRRAGFDGFQGMDDIFSHFADIFGVAGSGRGANRRGGDIQTEVHLSFQEAVKGCKKEISFNRHVPCKSCDGSGAKAGTRPQTCSACHGRGQVEQSMGFMRIASTCPTCRGQGRVVKERCDSCSGGGVTRKSETISVDIPAGVDEGHTLRVAGRGQAAPGAPPGNLYLQFVVDRDPRFERQDSDLYTEVPVRFATAALGGRIAVPTIEGDEWLDLPAGTQSGTVHTLRQRGVPHIQQRGRGDLHVRVQVVVPVQLNEAQRAAIEQLEAAFDGQPLVADEEERSGFFRRKKKRK